MKKYFAIAVALTMVCACGKEIVETTPDQADSGVTLFSGGFAETKISLGDKDGSVWKALWEDGDALTVKVGGETKGTATLVSGVGSNLGTFSYPGTIADGTDVELIYEEQAIDAEQSKASTDRSFKTSATANARVEAGSATFTMTHNSAVVRVNVASEELSGATLNAVILRCEGANLNADDGDYVRITLTDTPALSTTAKEIVFSVKEYDCTGKEIDIAFELTKDEESFTLPVGFTGKAIAANKVNSFVLGTLSEAYCVGWYEPHDTRLMPGPGYAYGDANTYFIQCKNGSTYDGGTYTPNDYIDDSVDISYKARGDFRYVSKPSGVSFKWFRKGTVDESGTGTGAIYTMRTNGFPASVDPTQFSFVPDYANYKVTVTNNGAYAGSPILLMVKDEKVMWAWTFWNIAADGTSIEPTKLHAAPEKKVITMDIGQATSNYQRWRDNGDLLARTIFKYQWGRPIPVFYESYMSLNFPDEYPKANIPAVVGPLSVEESIQHSGRLIVASKESGATLNDWRKTPDGSLWGNLSASASNTGTKTVYDPCPKGYRVWDRFTTKDVAVGQATWNSIVTINSTDYYYHSTYTKTGAESYWNRSGFYTSTTTTIDNAETPIGITARAANATANLNTQGGGIWWTSLCTSNADTQPSILLATGATALAASDGWGTAYVSAAGSVRCEVDTFNR